MGRIEFLQTGFNPYPDPPELGGGRYQEIIFCNKENKFIINYWS